MTFLETSFLWFEAVVASVAVAAALGVVGVYAILRRVVFLPAALSQISGVGVVAAFGIGVLAPSISDTLWVRPEFVALLVTLAAALALGWTREPKSLSREALIGISYVAASALVVIIGDRLPQEHHEVEDILFGNAVAVERAQMMIALATAGLVFVFHMLLLRPFVFSSFDAETAQAHGVSVRLFDAGLFLSMGLIISVATKTVGAMPVFAFSVMPAAAALRLFSSIRLVVIAAAGMGAVAAFLGYWLSFVGEFPTGACTALVTFLFFAATWVIAPVSRRLRSGSS